MRLRADGREFAGPAIDLSALGVSGRRVLRAVRDGEAATDGFAVAVECPAPNPVHRHVGHIAPEITLDLRGALAAAARSRDLTAPETAELRAARERLAALSPPDADPAAARRRAAEAGADERRLRERAATLRGRLQALREADDADAAAEAQRALADAVERLSEIETERIAAEQRLEQVERRARVARDEREARLRLQDRVANLERAARRSLVAVAWEDFSAAVAAVPGGGTAGDAPGSYRGDPVTAALAVARVADLAAPVVLSIRRFESAADAAARLDAPVVRV